MSDPIIRRIGRGDALDAYDMIDAIYFVSNLSNLGDSSEIFYICFYIMWGTCCTLRSDEKQETTMFSSKKSIWYNSIYFDTRHLYHVGHILHLEVRQRARNNHVF
jgi:hypothetical protein